MSERRRSPRQKSFLRGCIHFNRGRSALDCLIRDISEQGARIIFSETVNVPDRVDLYIPQKERTVRAHVQWRHGDEIGLAFPEAFLDLDGAAELTQRVAALESEINSLRRVLKRLTNEIHAGEDAI